MILLWWGTQDDDDMLNFPKTLLLEEGYTYWPQDWEQHLNHVHSPQNPKQILENACVKIQIVLFMRLFCNNNIVCTITVNNIVNRIMILSMYFEYTTKTLINNKFLVWHRCGPFFP